MKALRIEIGDRVACVAGFRRFGVVTCIVSAIRREAAVSRDDADDEDWVFEVQVGGLHRPEPDVRENVTWLCANLEVGDEIITRVVACDEADPPLETTRETRQDERAAKQAYLAGLREQIADLERELDDGE